MDVQRLAHGGKIGMPTQATVDMAQAARVVAQTVDDGTLCCGRQCTCGQKPGARERVGIFL